MNKKSISTPDKILENAPQSSKNLALLEAGDFSEEKLEQEAKTSEHSRREFSKWLIHKCNIGLIITLYIVMISSILTLGYHWVTSEGYHFLTHEQLNTLKNLVFSAVATNTAKDFLKNA